MAFEYDKTLFNEKQCKWIDKLISRGASEELLNIATLLNSDGDPVFNYRRIYLIYDGVDNGVPEEKIKIYCRLNDSGDTMYSYKQMSEIRYLLTEGLPDSVIDAVAKIEYGKPKYNDDQIGKLVDFILHTDKKRINLLVENINNGLSFDELLLYQDISPENLRILYSLYELNCDPEYIKNIVGQHFDYEELKNLKYLIKCADVCSVDTNLKPDDVHGSLWDIWDIKDAENLLIHELKSKYKLTTHDTNIVQKLIQIKAEPEAIILIARSSFIYSEKEKEKILECCMYGISVDTMRKAFKNAQLREKPSDILDRLINEAEFRKELQSNISCSTHEFNDEER